MTNIDQTNPIDQSIADKIVERIPEHTWDYVKATLITHIVDSMPSEILIKLTNDPEGFEKAEKFLFNYYKNPERHWDLINDVLQLFGDEYVLILFDSMELDKIPQL